MQTVPDLKKQEAEEAIHQRHLKQQEYLTKLLEDEAKLDIQNRARVNDLVRARLRQTKVAQTRKDLEDLQLEYERNAERKDAMIALLARYISIAEGQRKRQVQTHSRTVAELLQLLEERM